MNPVDNEKTLFEAYEESAVALFMDQYAQTIFLPTRQQVHTADSPQLQLVCQKQFQQHQRRENRKKFLKGTGRFFKRAALVAMAFLSLGSTLFLSVEAVREPILNFYIEQNDGNWKLRSLFGADSDVPESVLFNEKDPLGALLPEDFYLDSIEGNLTDDLMAIYYNDDQKVISFRSIRSDSSSYINTENSDVERLRIGEYDAVLSVRKGTEYAVLTWYNSDLEIFITIVTDSISKDELVRIAQTVNQQLMH